MKNKYTAIVLAAGKGKRMNSAVSKQYMELNGKPILYYSLKAFEESPVEQIILVTGKDDIEYCKKEIVEKYGLKKVSEIVSGGKERYDSVFNGLKAAQGAEYVLIHDGARAFLNGAIIENCMEDVIQSKACTAAVPVKDTIKKVDGNQMGVETPERSCLWTIQTPQAFSYELIWQAYEKLHKEQDQACAPSVTDDTMLVEHYMNKPAHMVMGSYFNIKVTTPEDMIFGKAILDSESI